MALGGENRREKNRVGAKLRGADDRAQRMGRDGNDPSHRAAGNGGLGAGSEFEQRTITELVLAPVSRWAIITGKLLAGWVTAMVVAGVVVSLGTLLGILRPSGWYWVPTLLVVALIGLASAGIGAAIGARLKQVQKIGPVAINMSIWLFFSASFI